VAEFSGQVRVLRYSAERVTGGCRCLVVRRRPAVPEDIVISAADPQQLLDWVNQEGGRKYVDCWCAIERTERREFRLVLTSLKRPASGRPPRRNRRNQRPRPKPNRRRKELKK
jgi:hypothetical protein